MKLKNVKRLTPLSMQNEHEFGLPNEKINTP